MAWLLQVKVNRARGLAMAPSHGNLYVKVTVQEVRAAKARVVTSPPVPATTNNPDWSWAESWSEVSSRQKFCRLLAAVADGLLHELTDLTFSPVQQVVLTEPGLSYSGSWVLYTADICFGRGMPLTAVAGGAENQWH
jgi:hypothetical protein